MTYSSEVLADSPWGFWEQAETSGTTLADSSPNARAMTITGPPALDQAGPFAGAKAIAWPSSVTTEAYAAADAVSVSTVTLEAWVYLAATPTASTPIIATAASYGSNTQRINLHVEAATNRVVFMTYRGGSSAVFVSTADALTLDTWHHVVASIGPDGTKIRVDKVTLASDGGTAISAGAEMVFLRGGGNSGGASDNMTDGSPVTIAAPALYTAQLSDARTDAHYDAAFAASATQLAAALAGGTAFTATLSVVGQAKQVAAALAADATLTGGLTMRARVTAALAADTSVAPTLTVQGRVALAATLAGQTGLAAALTRIVVTHLDTVTANKVNGRQRSGRLNLRIVNPLDIDATDEGVPASEGSTVRLHKQPYRIISPSLPAPTLVDGRPQ